MPVLGFKSFWLGDLCSQARTSARARLTFSLWPIFFADLELKLSLNSSVVSQSPAKPPRLASHLRPKFVARLSLFSLVEVLKCETIAVDLRSLNCSS